MDFIFQNAVSFTASFDTWTVLILLFWCFIGEAGVTIPYALESFWLLIGYNVGAGVLPPGYIIVLWIAAQIGRQAGTFVLYRIARFGTPAVEKFFHKIRLDRLFNRLKARAGSVGNTQLLSPLTVAFARMVGMRLPVMMVCAGKKKPGTLALGVVLSSIVWDALYISLGAIFGSTVEIPAVYMLMISLGCISVMYLITFAIRKLISRLRKPAAVAAVTGCPPEAQVAKPAPPMKEERGLKPARAKLSLALKLMAALSLIPVIMFNRPGKKLR